MAFLETPPFPDESREKPSPHISEEDLAEKASKADWRDQAIAKDLASGSGWNKVMEDAKMSDDDYKEIKRQRHKK